MQTEIASSLGYKSVEELERRTDEGSDMPVGDDGAPLEWFQLSREVHSSAITATNVLSDLLNYDKIESGQLHLELTVIPFWRLVERTVNEFRLPSTKKNIQLSLDLTGVLARAPNNNDDLETAAPVLVREGLTEDAENLKVVGDATRLTLALRNLLSNAIKFSHNGGQICVTGSLDRICRGGKKSPMKSFELKSGESISCPEEGQLKLTVQDSGVGMSKEQLANLFRDGVQFNVNELQAGQGSGLGLYISKGIVNQHDGTMSAKSDGLGSGTTFTITLPLYHVRSLDESICTTRTVPSDVVSEDASPSTGEESNAPMNILVVDDASSNRKLLGRLLKNRGHVFDEAENGQDAVEKVELAAQEGRPYDTLLMDYEMPVMNGPDAAKAIRKKGHGVFIVGVTGNLLLEDVKHFRSCGANAVLPKPFAIKELEKLWLKNSISAGAPLP